MQSAFEKQNTSLLAECETCKNKFEISENNGTLTFKKKFEVNEQSIFLTYYDCPKCGRRHYVQVDNKFTLQQFNDLKRQFIKLAAAKTKGKIILQKQSAKFKKAQEHLTHSRNELMKQYAGKLIHNSETDSDFILRFSV